jgi:hypothetical protein
MGEPVLAVASKQVPLDTAFLVPSAAHGAIASRLTFGALKAGAVESVRQHNALGARVTKRATQIGIARSAARESEVKQNLLSLRWQSAGAAMGGGMAAAIVARSPGAEGLRVGLRLKGLPASAQIRLAGEGGVPEVALRVSDTVRQRDEEGLFWTPLTIGEQQVIEFFVPDDSEMAGGVTLPPTIQVPTVTHFFATPKSGFGGESVLPLGASGTCNQDAVCAPQTSGFVNARNATAHLVYQSAGNGFVCTGTLLNDNDGTTQIPYFYTANHCIGDQNEAATLSTYWFYDNATCNAATDIARNSPSVAAVHGGSVLLYGTAASDVAFLRLNNSAPVGAYMLGWNSAAISVGASITVVHHPAGDPKKYSIGQVTGLDSQFARAGYTLGTTEGGSSGSGLLSQINGNYQLRGGLQGGTASCANTGVIGAAGNEDSYSRFDLAFPFIRGYLADPPPVVTISAGSGGSVSPAGSQTVSYNNSLFIAVQPNAGLMPAVTGTCGGTLLGSGFLTSAITGNCSVVVDFKPSSETLRVYPGTNVGDIPDSPGGPQTFGPSRVVNFSVSGITRPLAKLNVGFLATHTHVGDLRIVLTSPNGGPTVAVLVYPGSSIQTPYGHSADLRGAYYFGSGQTASFCAISATSSTVPTGGYQSLGQPDCAATSIFDAFEGIPPEQLNGVWSLTFMDGASGDTGVVLAAWLDVVEATQLFSVTSTVDNFGAIQPLGTRQIANGNTASFVILPLTNYAPHITSTCGGSLIGNVFTTLPITADCTVNATFVRVVFDVIVGVGSNGTMSPSYTIQAAVNSRPSFVVTPNPGYVATMSGTCGGTLSGNTFTTNLITATCTVFANFSLAKYTVTPGVLGNGTIAPSNPLLFDYGSTGQFAVTPDAGWQLNGVVGTCGGSLNGNVFTTLPLTGSCTVLAQFTLIPAAPGAPVLSAVTPGNARLVLAFVPGAINGSPITLYQAVCTDGVAMFNASAAHSPIAVEGLANGTPYQCSVTAVNGLGASPASNVIAVTPSAASPFTLVAVKSVKTHGAEGPIALSVDPAGVMGSTATVESRPPRPGHTLEFHFNDAVLAAGAANVMDATAMPVGFALTTRSGAVAQVDLSGIADGSAVRVKLDGVLGVTGTLNVQVDIAFLAADLGGTGRVSAADIAAVKACMGSAVTSRTAPCDLDQNGSINAADLALAKSRTGRSMQ